jgi:hypothetical protein
LQVLAIPIRKFTDKDRWQIAEDLTENFSIVMDLGIQVRDDLAQISSTLSGLVPNGHTDIVSLFTILLWTSILAVNTLPVLKDSISHIIYPNLEPYKVYLLTTVYALLLGAAGTSTYNLLNGLTDSTKWGLLSTSILLFIVSCIKSPFLLSVLDNLERPFGVTSRLGHIKYLVASAWSNKLGILKKNTYLAQLLVLTYFYRSWFWVKFWWFKPSRTFRITA